MQNKVHDGAAPAIVVQNVEKIYKLYDRPRDRVKEALVTIQKYIVEKKS